MDRNVCVDVTIYIFHVKHVCNYNFKILFIWQSLHQFYNEIKKDYERTGKCMFYLLNDNNIGGWYDSLMVDKGSPLKEAINNGYSINLIDGMLLLT